MLERRLPLTSQVETASGCVRMAALLEGPAKRWPDAALTLPRDPGRRAAQRDRAQGPGGMFLDDDTLRLRAAEVLEPIHQLRSDPGAGAHVRAVRDVSGRPARAGQPPKRVAELKCRAPGGDEARSTPWRGGAAVGGESDLPSLRSHRRARRRQAHKAGLVELVPRDRDDPTPAVRSGCPDDRQRGLITSKIATPRCDYYRRVLDGARSSDRAGSPGENSRRGPRARAAALKFIRGGRAGIQGKTGATTRLRRHWPALVTVLLTRASSELGRADEAVVALENVLQLFPADTEAALGLEHLYKTAAASAILPTC